MNSNEIQVRHTVRKDAEGKPLKNSFPANVWLKIRNIQTYAAAGKWEEITQTVPTPPEAKKTAPAKKTVRRAPAKKK